MVSISYRGYWGSILPEIEDVEVSEENKRLMDKYISDQMKISIMLKLEEDLLGKELALQMRRRKIDEWAAMLDQRENQEDEAR